MCDEGPKASKTKVTKDQAKAPSKRFRGPVAVRYYVFGEVLYFVLVLEMAVLAFSVRPSDLPSACHLLQYPLARKRKVVQFALVRP